jgi:hypothetical protein
MEFMISYRVRADRVTDHGRLLADVFAELDALQPEGLHYAVRVLADGRSYVDMVEGPDIPTALAALPAFQQYRAGLEERCETPISMSELTLVHSHAPDAAGRTE